MIERYPLPAAEWAVYLVGLAVIVAVGLVFWVALRGDDRTRAQRRFDNQPTRQATAPALFVVDSGPRPQPNHTPDRADNAGRHWAEEDPAGRGDEDPQPEPEPEQETPWQETPWWELPADPNEVAALAKGQPAASPLERFTHEWNRAELRERVMGERS